MLQWGPEESEENVIEFPFKFDNPFTLQRHNDRKQTMCRGLGAGLL